MHRFKVGQKVVALVSRSSKYGDINLIKGEQYTVLGFECCRGCGKPEVFLKEIQTTIIGVCGICRLERYEPLSFNADFFAPLQNNTDAIEYKMKVSIPELTEIKEVQHQ